MKPEKQLYQWDVNQYLTELQPTAEFVDYPIGNEVIRLETDGTRCRIPDEVLQTYGGKTCYERYPDGTFRAYSFSVLYAPKPPDYIYTPEERTTFEALTARVDSAIEEIKRRADSGEFTPKKGVDYFTDAEKVEMMESVSSGAVGEFRKVVDSATTEYNDNHNSKLAEYNANASEKLTTYDTNAEQHTGDYNRNAEVKLESYNQNHAVKVAEYNQNAETKTAEFDSNAAALQTEVDRLRGECDNLAAENRKQENRIDALIKLNKGQTYDILSEDGESASRTAPSGAKYVGIDKVGGKSVVWNQLVEHGNFDEASGWSGGTVSGNVLVITGTSDGTMNLTLYRDMKIQSGHKTLAMCDVYCGSANTARIRFPFNSLSVVSIAANTWTSVGQIGISDTSTRVGVQMNGINGETYKYRNFVCFDLTDMFGSTIADYIYSLEQSQAGAGVAWFKQMFPADYYHYSEPTIISSQTDRVDTVGFNQWDEEWEVGVFDNNGEPYGAATNAIRSKTFCKCVPNTTYYCRSSKTGSEYYIQLFYYDANKNFISRKYENNRTFTTPQNAHYFKICTQTSLYIYGGTYLNDICINLSDPSRNGEYEPYSLQQITTSFPVLNSAGSVYDYIDLNEWKLHQMVVVVDLGTLNYTYITSDNIPRFRAAPSGIKEGCQVVSSMYVYTGQSFSTLTSDKTVANFGPASNRLEFRNDSYTDATTFKAAMSGVMLVYELAEEVITDIDIPTELTEWLPVEAGGTVTFRNADDSKQLAVPNAVRWVRKLDEVE